MTLYPTRVALINYPLLTTCRRHELRQEPHDLLVPVVAGTTLADVGAEGHRLRVAHERDFTLRVEEALGQDPRDRATKVPGGRGCRGGQKSDDTVDKV